LPHPGYFADGGNLHLDSRDPPSINRVVRCARDGKQRDPWIGSFPQVGLAGARLSRDEALKKLRAAIDPMDERRGTACRLPSSPLSRLNCPTNPTASPRWRGASRSDRGPHRFSGGSQSVQTAADSGGSRPRIRDDVARQSDLMSLGVPR
jgi:hypothetical protein